MKFLYENFLQFYLLALTSIIQHTLGNLLSACSNDFTVEKSQIGRFLVAVKGKKGTQEDKKFWYIEHWNGKEFIDFSVGIDDIKLENNEIFQLELK
ncbi:hypothetical protein [Spiroplasma endosymbiont of Nomada rufipes]|uniref:hypothetical protein n=1 Tax=Spiroplasma endosymbiont of Nomada rufipes TaxID=3077933 RepID=UPI00376F1087